MSYHYTLCGSVSYGTYSIDVYKDTNNSENIDLSQIQNLLDGLSSGQSPKSLTNTLMVSYSDILKVDIKDAEDIIILTTEVNPASI